MSTPYGKKRSRNGGIKSDSPDPEMLAFSFHSFTQMLAMFLGETIWKRTEVNFLWLYLSLAYYENELCF